MTDRSDTYLETAEASWRWVLDQVRYDDGPWVPASVPEDGGGEPPWDRDGLHSGIGGLAHVLAEVRLTRAWTDEESLLAEAITERLCRVVAEQTDATLFDGLVGAMAVLLALEAPGSDRIVARLLELATDDGWPQTTIDSPRYRPGVRVSDLTLGTAGVLAGAVWALRHGVADAEALASVAADVLLAEALEMPTGTDWAFVPERYLVDPPGSRMPNLSHGLAGIASALALAGAELDRADLTAAAVSGTDHLVTLADLDDDGFVVPREIPTKPGNDEVTFTWCHGPTGTSLLFPALERAGVAQVSGAAPILWRRRCLTSVRASGLPERLRPGFWDNDGRCCGTAGVGDVFLDAWHADGRDDDLAFALHLADALVERAVVAEPHAYWRFLEHRADEPLLPPGVGWMQGAAGIAAYLFHASRVVTHGTQAKPAPRIDNWWAVGAAAG